VAAARVQLVGNGISTASTTDQAVTTTLSVAAGNHVILVCTGAADAQSLVSVSDTVGLTWQINVQIQGGTGSSATTVAIVSAYAPSGWASGAVATITWAVTNTRKAARFVEYSGLATASWFDVAASASGVTALSFDSTSTATTAQADELLIGGFSGRHATTTPVWTQGAGYTDGGSEIVSPTSSNNTLYEEYRVVSSTGAYSATATIDANTTGGWAAVVAAYKASGGAPPPSGTPTSYGPVQSGTSA
jgi:hypothetical protein